MSDLTLTLTVSDDGSAAVADAPQLLELGRCVEVMPQPQERPRAEPIQAVRGRPVLGGLHHVYESAVA